jgi:hypothetical protein
MNGHLSVQMYADTGNISEVPDSLSVRTENEQNKNSLVPANNSDIQHIECLQSKLIQLSINSDLLKD